MARQPMVTRTFMTTKVKILAVNVENEETSTVELVLPRTYKDKAAMLKMAQKIIDNEQLKYVHVIDFEEVETLYGMSESDFIIHAKVLPPRSVATENTEA